MLGRLKMTVKECIEKYVNLSKKVFNRKRLIPASIQLDIQGVFDSEKLRNL
jgi:hypothetical protein